MTTYGDLHALTSDLVEKILQSPSLSFQDMLSWHVASPQAVTRKIISAAGLRLYARRLCLNESWLLKEYLNKEDVVRKFICYLEAIAEAEERKDIMTVVTEDRVFHLQQGKLTLYGKPFLEFELEDADTSYDSGPRSLLFRHHIVKIAATDHHLVLLTDKGGVFTLCLNPEGLCTQPDEALSDLPARIECLQGIHIVDIAAPRDASIYIIAQDGRIFVDWQAHSFHQMRASACQPVPLHFTTTVPLDRAHVLQILPYRQKLLMLIGKNDGTRELYGADSSRIHTPRRAMDLIMAGGGLDAPIHASVQLFYPDDFSILLLSGHIVSISGEPCLPSNSVVASSEDGAIGERVVRMALEYDIYGKEVEFVLGEKGSVTSRYLIWDSDGRRIEQREWRFSQMCPGDRVVRMETTTCGWPIFSTRQGQAFVTFLPEDYPDGLFDNPEWDGPVWEMEEKYANRRFL